MCVSPNQPTSTYFGNFCTGFINKLSNVSFPLCSRAIVSRKRANAGRWLLAARIAAFARFTLLTNNVYVSSTVVVENCREKGNFVCENINLNIFYRNTLSRNYSRLAQKHRQHVAMAPRRPNDTAIRPNIADEFSEWSAPSRISRQLFGNR